MKRIVLVTLSAAAVTALAANGLAQMSQPRSGSAASSETIVPIPGTGTAEVKGNRLIGADVANARGEKLGDVEEVLVTTDGRVNAIVVGSGGVLGIGERKVILPWERLRFSSRGDALVVVTDATKETLRTLPEYRDPARASSQQQSPAAPTETPRADNTQPAPGMLDTSRPIRPVPKTE